MKQIHLFVATLLLPVAASFATGIGDIDSNIKIQSRQWIQSQSVRFLENKGQMTDMNDNPVHFVLFKTEAPGMNMYITEKGITYLFLKVEEEQEKKIDSRQSTIDNDKKNDNERKTEWERIDMELQGASIKKENIIKETASVTDFNFFLSHCPDGIYGVKKYEKIIVKEIYSGIDWILYNTGNKGFKYDFVVHPNADPKQIELIYSSLTPLNLKKDGSIEIQTNMGTLTEETPVSYQNSNEIPTGFIKRLNQKNKHGGYDAHIQFSVAHYDKDQTLVIDPQLQWGTYFGGNNYDGFTSVVTDNSGNVFVTGYTGSGNFPTYDPGGGTYFQGSNQGTTNIFLLKFTNSGMLLWATYYGGSGVDGGNSIAVDGNGNVFVTGYAKSVNFPTYDPGGGSYFQGIGGDDIILLKFNNSGVLLWATYYGGNANDTGISLSMDGSDNVFVTGYTRSTNFPTKNPLGGAYFQAVNSGGVDAFLLKFDNSGVLLWATYYGGSASDAGNSLVIGAGGNVFVTGWTTSTNIPTLNSGGGAYFQAANAGSGDVFLIKFNNTGSLLWATYYGGGGDDWGQSLASDGAGNIFATGYTSSINFPRKNPLGGAYFQAANAGGRDVFLFKLDPSEVLLWATYYGGGGDDSYAGSLDRRMTIDGSGNVFVTGWTTSTNFPTFNPGGGAYFQGTNAGSRDVFFLQFSNSGVQLWATYNGTSVIDFGTALAIDINGCLFTVGEWQGSGSNGLLNPGGAYYVSAWAGDDDSYIMKFCPATSILSITAVSTNINCNGTCTGTGTATPSGGAIPYTYLWNTTPVQTTQIATGLCAGTYTVIVTDASSATATATVTITHPMVLTATITSAGATCGSNNGSATVTAGGGTYGYTYNWNPSSQTTSTATGLVSGNYTATVTDANGCTQTQTVTVVSNNTLTINVSSTQTGCTVNNGTATATPLNGTAPYTYSWNNAQTTATAAFLAAGTYTVTVTDINGCTQTQTVTVTTISGPTVTAAASPVIVTSGAGTTLSASGGGAYNWSPSAGLSCITCSNPTAFPSSATIYCVTVTDTVTGCSDSACVTVLVETDCSSAGELYLPNAFSPNGDGENDKLQIYYGTLNCIKTFKLVIYSRWGEKVFETTNPIAQWDGSYGSDSLTINAGKMEGTTVFVYYLKATLISGEEITSEGNVSLIR